MNIGILTFHNNENKGALLQAYALRESLLSVFDANVSVIDYRTLSKERKRRNQIYITKRPWHIPKRIRDRRICEKFMKSEINASPNQIVTDDHEKAVQWLKNQNYDIIISGSDEIWKVNKKSTSVLDHLFPQRPFPNLYFLDSDILGLKVAYAASANRTRLENLTSKERQKLHSHLTSYDLISVRDRHSEQVLSELNIQDYYKVPDPTLLMDIPYRNNTKEILERNNIDTSKNILGFDGRTDAVFKNICNSYRDRGYQIVSPNESELADVNLNGEIDPFEYYSIFSEFNVVITDSLHSTIFSIKNETPFVTIDTADYYKCVESKTYSLLEDFGLLHRYIDATNGEVKSFFADQDRLEESLNKNRIKTIMKEQKDSGLEFLMLVKEEYEKSY